jgi:uncharacterized protein involved in type VI secretion and phage assembly
MAVRVVVSFPDQFTLQNRDIERLEFTQELYRHDRAQIVFFRDTNFPVTIDQLVGHDCQIKIYNDDSDLDPDLDIAFDGVTVTANQQHQLNGGSEWRLEVCSRTIFLDAERNLRVFPKLALPALLQLISPGIVTQGLPDREREDFVQWGESDWEFLVRAADEAGCFVRLAAGKLEVRRGFEHKGSVLTWGRDLLSLSVRAAPRNTGVKGWAYEVGKKEDYVFRDRRKEPSFTGVPALANAVIKLSRNFPSTGDPLLLPHQSRAPTLGEFRERVTAESERALGNTILVEGSSTRHQLAAGRTLVVDDAGTFKLPHPVGELGIVKLAHIWDGQQYRNEFVCSPWEHYTSPEPPARHIIHGLVTAECTSIDDPTSLGRVQIRLHFQKTDDALLWARVAAPFAGNNRGVQFLPEVGDEVAVAFEEGDPGRPYVVGAMWNGKDVPPDIKYKQIVTKSGNTVRISDEKDKEAIQIFTPGGACMLQLENVSGGATLTIHSEGDIAIEAKEELRVKCKNFVQVVDNSYERKAGNAEKAAAGSAMTFSGGEVTLAADMNLALSAGVNLDASAGAFANVSGALVNLNPPGFMKKPVSAAAPSLKASVWAGQTNPDATARLKHTFDPVPPRGLAVLVPAAPGVSAPAAGAGGAAAAGATTAKTSFIAIEMVDTQGKPVPGLAFVIELPDGVKKDGVLDKDGRARFEPIEPGECRITFPDLDKDSWKDKK